MEYDSNSCHDIGSSKYCVFIEYDEVSAEHILHVHGSNCVDRYDVRSSPSGP